MSLFDRFRKQEEKVDFSIIDTHEKIEEAAQKGILHPLYLMPLRFNGEESPGNRLFVPRAAVELKDRYDSVVEDLLVQGKVSGYSCTPKYKGKSFVPCQITIAASKDSQPVFTETIKIW